MRRECSSRSRGRRCGVRHVFGCSPGRIALGHLDHELIEQEPVFGLEVLDDLLLMAAHPARHDQHQALKLEQTHLGGVTQAGFWHWTGSPFLYTPVKRPLVPWMVLAWMTSHPELE